MADQSAIPEKSHVDEEIRADAHALSSELFNLRARLFPPTSIKPLRLFSSGEAAALIGISDAYLRQLSLADIGPSPASVVAGRRSYTLEQINEYRHVLSREGRNYLPRRVGSEHLQVIAVTNFKGGSGKTTTSAHLAQYLALRGFRVLAVDLDPQSSLSTLFGFQPETDLSENETLYAAIRYDDKRRTLSEIVRPTYFTGIDIVPANLELQEFEHDTPRILAMGKRGEHDLFFSRVKETFAQANDRYDVIVVDCPPQLGFLTLGALCSATGVLVTVHPQMLDIASMSQFLLMTADLLSVVRNAGGQLKYDFLRYLITRYEPQDGPQTQIVGFLRNLFGERVLTTPMLKSTAVSDAGLTKQTLYEINRQNLGRTTYSRAIEALDAVNGEVESLIKASWGRGA